MPEQLGGPVLQRRDAHRHQLRFSRPQGLVVTGAGGAILKTIPFTSNGVIPLAVTTSTLARLRRSRAGAGHTPTPTPTPPGTPVVLHGSHDQYIVADNNGSLLRPGYRGQPRRDANASLVSTR